MTTATSVDIGSRDALSANALSSMFQAVGGLRNTRAALAMLGCFALAVITAGLLWMMLGRGGAAYFFSGMLAIFLVFTGIHAAGVLLMEQARQIPMRTVSEAILYGMWCVPKTILLAIGLVLTAVAVYALLALLFFICKVPGIGPVLYAVVFPVSVVVAGLTFTGLFLGMLIALAAMWEGASITEAFAKAGAVLHRRLVEAVLLTFVVLLLAGMVFSFVGGVLMMGFFPALGMSVSTIGQSPELFGSFGSSMMGMMNGGGLGGYALAGGFGGALLFALTMTLVLQVLLLGVNLVFLRVTEGLDSSATEEAIQDRLASARRKAAEMGGKAKEAAERARSQAVQAMEERKAAAADAARARAEAAVLPVMPAVNVPTCPACASPASTEDVFCGSCGHRLSA